MALFRGKIKNLQICIWEVQAECSVHMQNLTEVLLPVLVLLSLPPG